MLAPIGRADDEKGPTVAAADLSAVVKAILSADEAPLDYGQTKLALDRLIDPACGGDDTIAQLAKMENGVRQLAGPAASPDATFAALRRLIYDAGPWNDHHPFAYDQIDPLGQRISNKLLSNYLASRRGNCVLMPALMLILADRLRLDITLANAPLYFFLHYRAESGRVLNIEATSGGHPARDEWFHRQMPMSDRAITNGIYMRSLSRRECLAAMATTVMEHLIEQGRLIEALRVSDVILKHAPKDTYTMVKQGTVCELLIQREFKQRYRTAALIPPPLRGRFVALAHHTAMIFRMAEHLGWQDVA